MFTAVAFMLALGVQAPAAKPTLQFVCGPEWQELQQGSGHYQVCEWRKCVQESGGKLVCK